ncbi:MAG: hypothetical protein A2X48_07125 [Lentisphaerae bacterium GWF2_49_21]|nr:MAG: hypothetical protein A2X48_07125 [Lentisphaerae bacterium GWF2_49_21]
MFIFGQITKMRIKVFDIYRNRTLSYFLLIVVLALGLRVARACIDDNLDKDSVIYMWMANKAAAGNFYDAAALNERMPPLYISAMAAGEYIGIGAYNTGMAVSILAGTLLLIPVFWLGKTIFDEKIGLIAAIIVATHPYLIRISAEIMRDSLFLLLLFAGLAYAVRATMGKSCYFWCVPGIFAGLAVMTRTEGIELLVAAMVWFAIEIYLAFRIGSGKKFLARALLSLFCLSAAFLIVTVPVQILLSKTPSTWGPVDQRIAGFYHGFMGNYQSGNMKK